VILPHDSRNVAAFRTHTYEKPDLDMMICRMLFPSSGRIGFERLSVHPDTDTRLFAKWSSLAKRYAEQHSKEHAERNIETKKSDDDHNDDDDEDLRREFLMTMLKREAALRLSSRAQHEMDIFRHNEGRVTLITEGLQLQVVREFGFHTQQEQEMGLRLLQSATNMYPDHPQVKDTFYVKFNRCEPGNLEVGMPCPDVSLSTPHGEKTTLMKYYAQRALTQCGYEEKKSDMPAPLLVVVAGSST